MTVAMESQGHFLIGMARLMRDFVKTAETRLARLEDAIPGVPPEARRQTTVNHS